MPDPASSIYLGAAAGLFSAATWALGSHLFARLLARHPEIGAPAANLFKNGLALIVFGAVMVVLGWPVPAGDQVGWLLLSGLLGFAVGDALYFTAFHLCGVQLAALSANLIPPTAAFLAWLMLDETLPLAAIAAMVVVLLGIGLVLTDKGGTIGGKRAPRPGLGFALAALAALSQAFAVVAGRKVLSDSSGEFSTFMVANVARLAGGVGGALLIAAMQSALRKQSASLVRLAVPWKRPYFVACATCATVAALINLPAFTYALGSLPAGVSSVLFGTTPLFTLPIAVALGARYGARAWIGTGVAFLGLILLVSSQ